MPRAPRATAESGFYHVILRGNGKQIIFEDDADRRAFLELLAKRAGDAGIHVLAWCLMENHVHLVLEDPTQALSEMMQRLSGDYAQRFNRKSGRVGHVFESRFKSCPVENEAYLLQAIRYVHDNPANAGICPAAEYPWSSYREYVGSAEIADTRLVLDMLGGAEGFIAYSHPEQRRAYRFDRRARVSDDEMGDVARIALGELPTHEVRALPKAERDQRLLDLRDVGLSVKQIERLTGIGTCTITRVTNKLRRTRADRAE